MNKEDKELQKQLVDEMMKVSKTNPDVMIYMQALMKKYEELEKENNQHISDIQVLMNKKENLEKLTKKLQKENEKLKQINEELKQSKLLNIEFQDMEQRLANYKSKNEKAIEYVEKSKLNQLDTYCKYLYINFATEKIEHLDDLLNILQGGDE